MGGVPNCEKSRLRENNTRAIFWASTKPSYKPLLESNTYSIENNLWEAWEVEGFFQQIFSCFENGRQRRKKQKFLKQDQNIV